MAIDFFSFFSLSSAPTLDLISQGRGGGHRSNQPRVIRRRGGCLMGSVEISAPVNGTCRRLKLRDKGSIFSFVVHLYLSCFLKFSFATPCQTPNHQLAIRALASRTGGTWRQDVNDSPGFHQNNTIVYGCLFSDLNLNSPLRFHVH